jgi:hypothetical protein
MNEQSSPTELTPLSDVRIFAARFAADLENSGEALGSLVSTKYEAFARVSNQVQPKWTAGTDVPAGSLDVEVASALAAVLTRFTRTPNQCYFGMWEGYAEFSAATEPKVMLPPEREMLIFTGPLSAIETPIQGDHAWRYPVRWWTEDAAWQVGADIYSTSVVVGAAPDCVAAIVASTQLHARALQPSEGPRIDDL